VPHERTYAVTRSVDLERQHKGENKWDVH
jgi:hypothetical protein